MKILFLNQFFWPDSSATSQLATDLARGLTARGHEVYSISAEGGYAIADGGEPPSVHRLYVRASSFKRGKLGRILSYASFYAGAIWKALTMPRMDVVVTLTTPPLLPLLGKAIKFVRGSRHFIWEMDMYPDVAVDTGVFPANGLLDRSVGMLADISRDHADGIIALGECMRDRLLARGVPAGRITVAHNWADSTAIVPLPFPGDRERLTLLYSGNLGLAHDLDTIVSTMKALRADPRFRFVFVGSGARRAELATFAEREQMRSIEMRPYVERGSLSESLALGDIGLVTQKDQCCGTVVPSKVYGLLAAGRPYLFIGPANAAPARMIRRYGCGWHIAGGDIDGCTSLLQQLADHPEDIHKAGALARQALLEHFDLPLGVARIADVLTATGSTTSPVSSAFGPTPQPFNAKP